MKNQSIGILLVILSANVVMAATSYIWIGPNEGLWSDTNNWYPSGTPGGDPTDTIVISGNPLTVFFDTSCTVESVTFNGDIILKGQLAATGRAGYTLEGNLTNNSKLDISSIKLVGGLINSSQCTLMLREITASFDLDNQGTLKWYLISTLDEFSSINNSGTMNILNPGVVVSYGSMVNTGTIYLVDTTLNFYSGASFTNEGTVYGSGYLFSGTPITNYGSIYSRFADLLVVSPGEFINEGNIFNDPGTHLAIGVQGPFPLRNRALIKASSGGGVSILCTSLINEENGFIDFKGGFLRASVQAEASSTVEGRGELIGTLTAKANSQIYLYKTFTVVSDFVVNSGAAVTVEDAEVLVEGNITNDGVIHLRSSRLIPRGGLFGSGQISWEMSDYNTMTDYNFDGTVDIEDLMTFSQSWLWVSPIQ